MRLTFAQWVNLSGANSTSYAVANAQVANAGNYAVLIANQYGYAISQNAMLSILPAISTQPVSQTVLWGPARPSA